MTRGKVMDRLCSADGTAIAFEVLGEGEPLIVVAGTNCGATVSRPLAAELAQTRLVINDDRRGRGESGDTPPYSPDREVEDLQTLVERAGGKASVYGHSAGAAVARVRGRAL